MRPVSILFTALALCSFIATGAGCFNQHTHLDADDFAKALATGTFKAGAELPSFDEYGDVHLGWCQHSVPDGHGGGFLTCVATSWHRVITIYSHQGKMFAACTLEDGAAPGNLGVPKQVWHFFDADLMRRHVEACQAYLKQRAEMDAELKRRMIERLKRDAEEAAERRR